MAADPSFRLTGTSFDPLGIIKTVTASILEVFLLCLAGYVLSVKGIIDSKSKNTLNKINVSFFTPALMFSKVAFSLTSEKLADLYVVPISFVVITLTSCLVAWLLSKLFRLERSERNFCLSFSMFMNSNSLPIALISSLISTIHGQDGLKWGTDDSKDKQLGRSLTYLVVFSTMGLIFRWSYGVKLLSASVGTEDDHDSVHNEDVEDGSRSHEESVPFLTSIDRPTPKSSLDLDRQPTFQHSSSDQLVSPTDTNHPLPSNLRPRLSLDSIDNSSQAQPSPIIEQSEDHLQAHLQRPIFHSFPNVREYWMQSISSKRNSIATSYTSNNESIESISEQALPEERRPRRLSHHGTRHSRRMKTTRKLFRWLVFRPVLRINQFMTPPLYAAFLSLIVVSLPRLQQYLEEIRPLRSALKSAGNVSVPLTLVVLGAYFNASDPNKPKADSSSTEVATQSLTPAEQKIQARLRKTKRVERLTILGSILARMIITPLILIPLLFMILRYFHKRGNDQAGEDPTGSSRFHEDPCFILVTVLLIGAPPAITLAQMTNANPFPIGSKSFKIQALQNAKFEKLVSKTLFISYALITPPTTIALVVLGLLIEANR
ncbi:hypothetical protein PtA15_16A214 [Puccinia triticina]|uniref:Endoplasmic reticulum protein n=1 Tax=Puccinia triticina TaxID=208348 RepID=A0ABY7D6T1_9BASI|nr:uncharacterized protein PtA15_16A214 [Puccinia triticina]WAQ92308.1 hypothetical protein PtA15_16A214 [Puccinia triticina]WAR64045.1 hypothetical protein PtB15_16B204 [Puccinia triticina]